MPAKSSSGSLSEAFRSYEAFRRPFCNRTVAVSRQLGMARQGLAPGAPRSAEEWEALSHESFASLMGDGRTYDGSKPLIRGANAAAL